MSSYGGRGTVRGGEGFSKIRASAHASAASSWRRWHEHPDLAHRRDKPAWRRRATWRKACRSCLHAHLIGHPRDRPKAPAPLEARTSEEPTDARSGSLGIQAVITLAPQGSSRSCGPRRCWAAWARGSAADGRSLPARKAGTARGRRNRRRGGGVLRRGSHRPAHRRISKRKGTEVACAQFKSRPRSELARQRLLQQHLDPARLLAHSRQEPVPLHPYRIRTESHCVTRDEALPGRVRPCRNSADSHEWRRMTSPRSPIAKDWKSWCRGFNPLPAHHLSRHLAPALSELSPSCH